MSLKTILQKWLGIEQPTKRVSAARAYQAPIKITYHDGESIKHVGTHYLPFEKTASKTKFKRTMPQSRNAPKTTNDFYNACGGYEVFRDILRHGNWYNVRRDNRKDGFTHTIRVLNRNNKTGKGFYESKTMRVSSKQEGEAVAKTLLDIHALQIRMRSTH